MPAFGKRARDFTLSMSTEGGRNVGRLEFISDATINTCIYTNWPLCILDSKRILLHNWSQAFGDLTFLKGLSSLIVMASPAEDYHSSPSEFSYLADAIGSRSRTPQSTTSQTPATSQTSEPMNLPSAGSPAPHPERPSQRHRYTPSNTGVEDIDSWTLAELEGRRLEQEQEQDRNREWARTRAQGVNQAITQHRRELLGEEEMFICVAERWQRRRQSTQQASNLPGISPNVQYTDVQDYDSDEEDSQGTVNPRHLEIWPPDAANPIPVTFEEAHQLTGNWPNCPTWPTSASDAPAPNTAAHQASNLQESAQDALALISPTINEAGPVPNSQASASDALSSHTATSQEASHVSNSQASTPYVPDPNAVDPQEPILKHP